MVHSGLPSPTQNQEKKRKKNNLQERNCYNKKTQFVESFSEIEAPIF